MPETVRVRAGDAALDAVVRIDTAIEADYYCHGVILTYVVRSMLTQARSAHGESR